MTDKRALAKNPWNLCGGWGLGVLLLVYPLTAQPSAVGVADRPELAALGSAADLASVDPLLLERFTTLIAEGTLDSEELVTVREAIDLQVDTARLSRLDFTVEGLRQALDCVGGVGPCSLDPGLEDTLRDVLAEPRSSFDEPHGCGMPTVGLLTGLASRLGPAAEILPRLARHGSLDGEPLAIAPGTVLEPLPDPVLDPGVLGGSVGGVVVDPPIWEHHGGCVDPPAFISPARQFSIRYSTCIGPDRVPDPTTDTAGVVVGLDGVAVPRSSGGGFSASNAPDSIERLAVLLDSAHAILLRGGMTRLRRSGNFYPVHVKVPSWNWVNGTMAMVDPVMGTMELHPDEMLSVLGTPGDSSAEILAVHEFIHQVQMDYGWGLGALITDDNANFSNWQRNGRYLIEGFANALALHVQHRFPSYLDATRTTNYLDFWTYGYDPVPYGFAMQVLTSSSPGSPCFGCDAAHGLFGRFAATSWSRQELQTVLQAVDPALTTLGIPRTVYLHDLYDQFARVPDFVPLPGFRWVHTQAPQRLGTRVEANKACLGSTPTMVAVRADTTTTCRVSPGSEGGVPAMVAFPVNSLPEQLHVQLSISYRRLTAAGGGEVAKLGGLDLKTRVRIHQAQGDLSAYTQPLGFTINPLLSDRPSYDKSLGPGTSLATLDFNVIDFPTRTRVLPVREPGSLAITFEWDHVPPLQTIQPIYDIRLVPKRLDADRDGIFDRQDLCPLDADKTNTDFDGDRVGDVCDADDDNDAIPDTDDACPRSPSTCANDRDGDNIPNAADNCPDHSNWDQRDRDGDDRGDACDSDSKPDLVITLGSIPAAGAGFVVENIGTAKAEGPITYHVAGYRLRGGQRNAFRRTLPFPFPATGLLPGRRASVEIPTDLIDASAAGEYQNVVVTIDSDEQLDELDESNNRFVLQR